MESDIQARIAEAIAVQSGGVGVVGLTELIDPTQRTTENWSDAVRAGVSYYRVPDRTMPRGRITLLQNGTNATEMIEFRGYVSLRAAYGGFRSANQVGDWQRNDPYLGIVQRGGLHEFDGAQIHGLKWHHRPHRDALAAHRLVYAQIQARLDAGADRAAAILAALPQLAGFDLDEHWCDLCRERSGGGFATQKHLDDHRSVQHQAAVVTEGTRDAVAAALKASGSNMNDLVAALSGLVEQLAAQRTPSAGESAPDIGTKRESKR